MIDINKISKRIEVLKSGKSLLLVHSCYGIFKIKMNPQQNRIFIDKVYESTYAYDKISPMYKEAQINYLLFWDCGEWYVLNKKEVPPTSQLLPLDKIKEKYDLEVI